ncbi:hypothetical protein QZH41_019781, partial [Actinostola sp. cb2023]
ISVTIISPIEMIRTKLQSRSGYKYKAIYWTSYEYLRSRTAEPGFGTAFMSGAGSGLVAAMLTQPFDVVKTHRQMELGEMEFSPQKKLPFTASILLTLYREKGFSSLFAGLAPRMAKVPPACAIMISIYEYGKSFFKQHNLNRTDS